MKAKAGTTETGASVGASDGQVLSNCCSWLWDGMFVRWLLRGLGTLDTGTSPSTSSDIANWGHTLLSPEQHLKAGEREGRSLRVTLNEATLGTCVDQVLSNEVKPRHLEHSTLFEFKLIFEIL